MSVITESAWWRDAVAGKPTPINASAPQPGYYATRAYRGGPLLPARIWIDGPHVYCMVNGEQRRALSDWPYLAGKPITAEAYKSLLHHHGAASKGATTKRRVADLDPPF